MVLAVDAFNRTAVGSLGQRSPGDPAQVEWSGLGWSVHGSREAQPSSRSIKRNRSGGKTN
jgi:hypothetical protein